MVAAVDAASETDGFRVTTIGNGSVGNEFDRLAEETLIRGESLGIGVALIILLIVFGAAVAAGLPLILAIGSILLAIGMTTVVGQAMDLSSFVTNMITMIGLAVGIDYSLFVVQRFREERAKGHPVLDAVERAGDTATRAVFFSGVTVVIALLGLLYMPDTVMRSLGMGAILVVVAAVAAALTLLPAMLGLARRPSEQGQGAVRERRRLPRRWGTVLASGHRDRHRPAHHQRRARRRHPPGGGGALPDHQHRLELHRVAARRLTVPARLDGAQRQLRHRHHLHVHRGRR